MTWDFGDGGGGDSPGDGDPTSSSPSSPSSSPKATESTKGRATAQLEALVRKSRAEKRELDRQIDEAVAAANAAVAAAGDNKDKGSSSRRSSSGGSDRVAVATAGRKKNTGLPPPLPAELEALARARRAEKQKSDQKVDETAAAAAAGEAAGAGDKGGEAKGKSDDDDAAGRRGSNRRSSSGGDKKEKLWNSDLAAALEVRALHKKRNPRPEEVALTKPSPRSSGGPRGFAQRHGAAMRARRPSWEDWNNAAEGVRALGTEEESPLRTDNAPEVLSGSRFAATVFACTSGVMVPRVVDACLGIVRGEEKVVPRGMRQAAEMALKTRRDVMREGEREVLARCLGEEEEEDEDEETTQKDAKEKTEEKKEKTKAKAKDDGKENDKEKKEEKDKETTKTKVQAEGDDENENENETEEEKKKDPEEKSGRTLPGRHRDPPQSMPATKKAVDLPVLPPAPDGWYHLNAEWQSAAHIDSRNLLSSDLCWLLKNKAARDSNLSPDTWKMTRHVETVLYRNAPSLKAYLDYLTVERRADLVVAAIQRGELLSNWSWTNSPYVEGLYPPEGEAEDDVNNGKERDRDDEAANRALDEAEAAATEVQAVVRGHLVRNDLRRKSRLAIMLGAAARGAAVRRRQSARSEAATALAAAARGTAARRRHRADIDAGFAEWKAVADEWRGARTLIRKALSEAAAAAEKGGQLNSGGSGPVFSWSKLKRDRFDISQFNDDAQVDQEGLDTTSQRIDEAYRTASSLGEESHERSSSDREGDAAAVDRIEVGKAAMVSSDPASKPSQIATSGEQQGLAEAFENILLTHSVLKWFKGADGTYQDMFRRRLRQLASGDRSRILAKLLTGCKHTIYETYLDQASAQRIIWTECREREAGRGEGEEDDDGTRPTRTSILVWYVSKHKWVSRYLEQIDGALARMNRQQFSTSAAHLFEDELERGKMSLDSDMILLDPLANVPLKIHQLPVSDIDKLDKAAWTPPLRLTAAEKEVVRKPGTVLVLGRSGTGKTVCICNRMVCDAEFHRGPMRLRQLFVARSTRIKNLVQSLVEEESPEGRLCPTVERKFVSYARLMKDCVAALERLGGERSVANDNGMWAAQWHQQTVDFSQFKSDFFQTICKEDGKDLGALIIWTQIRSYIKGSIEAVEKGRPLSLEEYLLLGKNRCRLDGERRRYAYSIYEAYSQWLSINNKYDACDRTANILHRLRRTSVADRLKERVNFSRIYVDETQDFTQSEIALFWVLCEGGGSLFLAGDTAQSVEEGINFRFDEVRSVCHVLSCGDRKSVPEKPLNVTLNFRSHSGVLDVAVAVLHLLYQAFPGAANKLPDDVGLFKGPRPSVLCRRDDKFLDDTTLREVLKKNPSLVVLTPDDHLDCLKENLSSVSETIILGACEAKGLDFDQVAIVNFFSSSTKQQERAWKELFKSASGKQSAWEMSRYPELEMRMKLLYTAITRCRHRLFFAETANSASGDAFMRWILGGSSKRAEKQDAADMTVELKSPDEWLSLGIEYALNAEMQDEAQSAKGWFERASVCFKHGGNEELRRLASSHANLRRILEDNARIADWSTRKRWTPQAVASCFEHGGFVEDAIQLCEAVLDQCPSSGEKKFEEIVDAVLLDLKSLARVLD